MATVRRAGFGSVFEVENEKVGIGTTGTATNTLQVLGNVVSSDAAVIGISTIPQYKGFLDKNTNLRSSVIDIERQSGSMTNIIIDGDVVVSSATTFCSGVNQLTVTNSFGVPTGNTDDRVHCQTAGSTRFNEDLGTLEFYTGEQWMVVNSKIDTGSSGRGVFFGGYISPSHQNTIDFINIQSGGNSQAFGTLSVGTRINTALANNIRGLNCGGFETPTSFSDRIEYITIATKGNPIDFGDLTDARYSPIGVASRTRGVICTGRNSSGRTNIIDYVEIMTLGNALDFGDTTFAVYQPSGCSSPTRGIVAAGQASPQGDLSHIDYITIASKGNGRTFGDLGNNAYGGSSGASSTRGIFGAFENDKKHIHYITIASTGNSVYFGDLNTPFSSCASGTVSSQTRAVIAGGRNPANVNTIESVEIASTGNAVDFGDRMIKAQQFSGLSDSHGGLGGGF